MNSEKTILAIVKYAKARYGLDVSANKDETVIKTAVYLARLKRDDNLSRLLEECSLKKRSDNKIDINQKSIPILKKSISVRPSSRSRAI